MSKTKDRRKKAARPRVSKARRRAANIPATQMGLGLKGVQEIMEGLPTQLVPLDLIDERPGNRAGQPVTKESVAGLAENIQSEGMHHDVWLKPKEDGRFLLVDGHRRLRAHQVLKAERIQAKVYDWPDELVEIIAASANLQRLGMDPWSEAVALKKSREANPGVTVETLARRFGLPEGRVRSRLSLADLPGRVGALIVDEGEVLQENVDLLRTFLGTPGRPTVADPEEYQEVVAAVEAFLEHLGVSHNARVQEWDLRNAIVGASDGYDLSARDFRELKDRAPFKRAVAELRAAGQLLETTSRGDRKVIIALDGARIDQALAEIQKADEERAEKVRAKEAERKKAEGVVGGHVSPEATQEVTEAEADRTDEQHERELANVFHQRAAVAIVRAVKARVQDAGDAEAFRALARFVESEAHIPLDAADALAHELGVTLQTVGWSGNPMSGAHYHKQRANVHIAKSASQLYDRGERQLAAQLLVGVVALDLDAPSDWHDDPERFRSGEEDDTLVQHYPRYTYWTGERPGALWERVKAEVLPTLGGKPPEWRTTPKSVACLACGAAVKSFCVGHDGRVMRRTFHFARIRAFRHQQAGTPNPDAAAGGPMGGWDKAQKDRAGQVREEPAACSDCGQQIANSAGAEEAEGQEALCGSCRDLRGAVAPAVEALGGGEADAAEAVEHGSVEADPDGEEVEVGEAQPPMGAV